MSWQLSKEELGGGGMESRTGSSETWGPTADDDVGHLTRDRAPRTTFSLPSLKSVMALS